MPAIKLEIVTAERLVYSEDVDSVTLEGVEGQMTVLPNHAPLITTLAPGALVFRKNRDEILMAISGGFVEVRPDKIVVLADACERSDEIDVERALAARQRAEERLKTLVPEVDQSRAEAALRRSLARIRVAERRKKPVGYRPSP